MLEEADRGGLADVDQLHRIRSAQPVLEHVLDVEHALRHRGADGELLRPSQSTGETKVPHRNGQTARAGSVVEESLAAERTADEMTRSKDRPSAVHGRAGAECPVCGDEVRAVEYRTYTVNYCATCQTGGKVLADNTTSKFLK